MITYRIEINDGAVTKLFNRLDHSAVMRTLRPPMEASLIVLHSDLTDYPPPSHGKVTFKSARQRKYFFWALKNGVIQVPYVRTGKLGQSWTYKIETTGAGLRGVIGTNMGYARWVQNEDSQAAIHRGNWLTDARVVSQRRDEIGRRFAAAIKRAMAGGMGE
jgi:hypothetical protein